MKKSFILIFMIGVIMTGCKKNESSNPFFDEWKTPFGTPPFNEIKDEHYLPAYLEGMKQHNAEIEAVINNTEEPTFENTIEALDRAGKLLTKVRRYFGNIKATDTNDKMQEVAEKTAPLLSKHFDDISLNEKLFAKVKFVYDKKNDLNLTTEQARLLENFYKEFVRGGALLEGADRDEFRKINEELSLLNVDFEKKLLAENNAFTLVIENEEDLTGLPQGVIDAASEAAADKNLSGKWVFTLDKPSFIPFLQYSKKRDLREKIYKAYTNRGNNNNENDTKLIAGKVAALRVKRANLLGFKTHADFVLDVQMAKKPDAVYDLLLKLWKPALAKAKNEVTEMQAIINKENGNFKLQPWDWWFYSEKVKQEKYALDEEMIRPYFELKNVVSGVFEVATKLWGIQFEELKDMQVYNPDVKIYELKESDGTHIGILYTDYFPRSSKTGGAWMDAFRKQSKENGKNISPVVYNVGNFTKPVAGKPSLLSLDEVETLFHEFGHALHGLLSNCTYESISGTSVATDFVELPSQIMENWAFEPEVLKLYARHYETGETIPASLIEKIEKSGKFNQGFNTVEYLSACLLDMEIHTLTEAKEIDIIDFEKSAMEKYGLIDEILPRYRSTYFAHIWGWGYSAGYYSYIWAEVLDADAFAAFKEKGIFDQETAKSFRENILSRGGSDEEMVLYKNFRGREPGVEPLIKKRGLQ